MTNKHQEKLDILRHSTAHVLAAAVLDMFPETKFGIGPTIEDGFYYDFDLPRTLIPEDLPILEEKMRELFKQNLLFEKKEISTNKALELFKKAKQDYKVELIEDLKKEGEKEIRVYKTGNFVDLCRGPHIDSTGEIQSDAFKLLKIAGAYWKGSEKNKMLQRIYGTTFETKQELDNYLNRLEEAKRRDHRKIGQELALFSFHLEAPGMPFFHPKGFIIYKLLIDLWRKIQEPYNYQEVQAPNMLDVELWKQSGHYDHYKDDMFFVKSDEKKYALRPMDCPGEILIYKTGLKSYRDLPLRFSELGVITRNERSGTLAGLFRAVQFTQDDAHIFCTEDQILEEILTVMKMIEKLYGIFGLNYKVVLSTRPENFMGDKKTWDKAEKDLAEAIKANNKGFQISEGDGAFYGPKIDFWIKDSLSRDWQCGTIQLDFQMPQKFNLEYIGEDGKAHRPVMIHRTLMGSIERFIGILTEHYAGALPTWLSPIQVWIIPIGENHINYAKEIFKKIFDAGIRTELKNDSETVSKKIREGELQKIPYLLVVGDKEIESQTVTVRQRDTKELEQMPVDEFKEKILKEISL